MSDTISRRSFFKKSAQAGMTAALGSAALTHGTGTPAEAQTQSVISVVTGEDYYENTVKAVGLIGGMEKFVTKGAKVAILPNAQRWHPGTFTRPEIVKAVADMCFKAGAKEVNCISQQSERNWKETGNAAVFEEAGVKLILVKRADAESFKSVATGGQTLKEAEIMKELYNNDVFINIPVTKDHAGNKFTGTLKNLMGINSGPNNRSFHKDDWKTNKDSIAFLDYCIVDLNLIVKPDLNVVDATEFITTNGPMGPGELKKADKIVAGTDRVAMDSYCTTLFGLKGEDIFMIKKASEYKLGEINLDKVKILTG